MLPLFFFITIRRQRRSTLFPYTTLFRSMGMLNTYRRYFIPALAPAAFNVVAVVGGGVLLLVALEPEPALLVWSVLVVADRKSTRLNSSHSQISYAVFCLKKKTILMRCKF